MKLTGPDYFAWMGLRRVRRGGLGVLDGHYYDHGAPVPGCLIPTLVEALLEQDMLELAAPDESGMRRVELTEAGQAHYRLLCRRQRRKEPVASPPEHDHTTQTPAGRRSSTAALAPPGGQPDPA